MTVRLQLTGLTKRFCHDARLASRYALADIARECLGLPGAAQRRAGEFTAVDQIGLTLRAGEALALVGENGSGKSTLLKLVCGLIKPSAGSVRRVGGIGAILELGAAFNPALTGRENLVLGIAAAGRDTTHCHGLVSRMIDFAEIDVAIDAPLQTYSTGMKTRLAYALETHLEPDLLLVDEALAVGDMHFQRKCITHMRDYVQQGGALLLVSHNSFQVQSVCDRGVFLEQGRAIVDGTAVEALSAMFEHRRTSCETAAEPPPSRTGTAITGLKIEAGEGEPLETGQPAHLVLSYRAAERVSIRWGFALWSGDMAICIASALDRSDRQLQPGEGALRCTLPALPLIAGRYRLSASIIDSASGQAIDMRGYDDAPVFVDVSAPPDDFLNTQRELGQLTTIAVDWR